MRKQRVCLLGWFLLLVPCVAGAQVFVVSPAAGTASSYRTTVLRWLPIPGVASYHLQVDDDPTFRSPEVDVVVDRPFYALKGETLRLNGQLAWAAYVRVNGARWEWPSYAPSYISRATWPEVAVDSVGKVYYGYLGGVFGEAHAFVRTSDDFSTALRLSPPETDGNPHGFSLDVDPSDVAHAFWTEQISGQSSFPFHATSPDWTPESLGDIVFGVLDVGPSVVFTGGRIEMFDEKIGSVVRFTSTDGHTFTRSTVPNSGGAISIQAALDPAGNIVLVEERLGSNVVLQRSSTNWAPEVIGEGRWPSLAIGADGVVHVVKRDDLTGEVSYSNSGRGFATWTPVPIPPVISQQLLPIVVDEARQMLYLASPAPDGVRLCAATPAGESWSCRRIGGAEGNHPTLILDARGVLHVGWADALGGGYANSLGSFLAVNLPAQAQFAPPVAWPNTAIVDTTVADGDGDQVRGSIAVGVSRHDRRVLNRDETFPILGVEVVNSGEGFFAGDSALLFRLPGGDWRSAIGRGEVTSFPTTIAVRTLDGRLVDAFTIEAWTQSALAVDQEAFTAHARKAFTGAELPSFDLQSLPAGALTLRVSVTDGASWRAFDANFVRAPGQNSLTLIDFRLAADRLGVVLDTIPPSHLIAPALAPVLRFRLDEVVIALERALVTLDRATRATLLDRAEATLRDRVLRRADGCAAGGQPDEDDWVRDCGDQDRFSQAGARLLRAVDALQ